MSTTRILRRLQEKGAKLTTARRSLVMVFEKHHLPLTELELRRRLARYGVVVNKTTIYRELSYLKSQGFVMEVEFGDGKKRFELNTGDHHHHLVCLHCKQVTEARSVEDIRRIERKIKRQERFQVLDHTLEFFGLCRNCS